MPNQEIRSIQYLRGLAAILVVYFHTKVYLSAFEWHLPRQFGYVGVDIFFCISGFIMMQTTSSKNDTPLQFLKKRAVRIYPMYWFATLICAGLYLAVPSAFIDGAWTPFELVASMLLVAHGDAPVLRVGWTLVFEMYFYCIFAAALLLATPGRRLAAVAAFLIALVGAGIALQPENPVLQTYTNGFVLEFLFGAVIGYWSFRAKTTPLPNWLLVALIGVACLVIGLGAGRGDGLARIAWFGLPAAAIVFATVALERRGKLGRSSMLGFLGDASYSIYLFHPFVLSAARLVSSKLGLTGPVAGAGVVVGSVLASVVAGCIAYRLLEAPLQKALRRFLFKRPPVATESAGDPAARRLSARPAI